MTSRNHAVPMAGGRLKLDRWRPFVRPAGWAAAAFAQTAHLHRRCAERRIPAGAVALGLRFADRVERLDDGKLKLALTRRAARRVAHAAEAGRVRARLDRLVLIVAENGAVVTAWIDARPRPSRRPEIQGEADPPARHH